MHEHVNGMARFRFIFGIALLLAMAACSNVFESDDLMEQLDPVQYSLGEELYIENCASCHGINGEGQRPDAPLQPDETGRYPAPPHNDTGHTWHHDDDLLISIIKNGNNVNGFYPMPGFANSLTAEEIEAVLVYIKGMWTEEQRRMQNEVTRAVREQKESSN